MRALLLLLLLITVPGFAATEDNLESRFDEVLKLLRAQQDELELQRKLILQQGARIDQLQSELDAEKNTSEISVSAALPQEPARVAVEEIEDLIKPSETVIEAPEPSANEIRDEKLALAKITTAESGEAQEDDPTRAIMESLPGAMRLPGTNAVMRWGGFVKSTFVQSFDPLAITDQFITGAIPTDDAIGSEQENDITVSQSRLSVDLREPTDFGLLRGFIEADFAEDNDTFRLRHAFAQRGNVLIGKTWSGFVDRTASPEEIDFEGLNGRINVRQAQFRFQPRFGKRFETLVSLEDPAPRVTNGIGVSKIPDMVISGRVNFRDGIHFRIAALLRQVRAQWELDPSQTAQEFGWGLSVSGRIDATRWDRRDKIQFQLNAGKGYGRYVNDLRSVGGFDGIFSPTGELELIDVLSGYVSGQHWWGPTMRTNVTFGFVELENPAFVDDDFYQRTFRASSNLIWSPSPRIDVGGELLWGRKKTEGGDAGEALQFQMAVKYLF